MTKRTITLVFLTLLLVAFTAQGQNNAQKNGLQSITKEVIEGQLEFLASDWTEGRETGTKGAYMAADYIASMFKLYGIQPGGDMQQMSFGRGFGGGTRGQSTRPEPKKTYFQSFDLVESAPGPVQELSVITKAGGGQQAVDFNYLTDFSLSAGQVGIEAEVPVVFVGYGLVDEKNGYDDFKGLDLKGKIVIKLTGFPGHLDTSSKTYAKFKPEAPAQMDDQAARIQRFRGGGSRFPWATEKGVLGLIDYRTGNNPTAQWASNIPFRYNTSRYEGDVPQTSGRSRMSMMGSTVGGGMITLTVTDRVISELLNGLGYDFAALEKQIQETGKPASRVLAGKFIHIKTTVESKITRVRNVVGYLEGEDTKNVIVIGAHYDHLGKQNGFIYNGADDNASGTVGVMTIAKAMMASGVKPKQSILFCAWTGEEKGLLGSSYFTDNHYDYNILCNLNYDMISRNSPGEDQDNKISVNYSNSKPLFMELVDKYNKEYEMGLDISFRGSDQPGGGSDHAPFARKGYPIYYFMAGMPAEYHQFNDHIELVNWDKMLKIVQLGYLSIFDLANMGW